MSNSMAVSTIFVVDQVVTKLAADGFRLVVLPAGREEEQPRWAVAYEPNADTEGSDYLPGLGFVMPEATIGYGDSFPEAIRDLAAQLGLL